MATFMCYITGKPTRTVLWILISILLLQRVLPLVLSSSVHVWIAIKGRKFMYIVLNSIIISILISSSSFIPYLTNIFLKLHKKLKLQFDSQKVISPPLHEDDSWWFFTYLDYEQQPMESTTTSTTEEEKTVSLFRVHGQEEPMKNTITSTTEEEKTVSLFRVHGQEQPMESTTTSPIEGGKTVSLFLVHGQEQPMENTTTSTTKGEKTVSLFLVHGQEQPMESTTTSTTEEKTGWSLVLQEEEYCKDEKNHEKIENIVEGKEAEEDGLDATWKAIMESQGKGNRPQLKKNDTWSCGDGGGEESRKGKEGMGGLSKYRVQEQLKKWKSFRDMVERRGNTDGDIRSSGGKRGWRSMEVALTFHDEFKKRADEFIARFTHDIRLQRLESDQRFLEMINRGL